MQSLGKSSSGAGVLRAALAVAAVGLAVGLGACGSSDDEGGGGGSSGGKADKGPIVVAGWGGRYTEATKRFLTDPFTEETGIEVQIVDAPGTQVAGLQQQKQASTPQWDMVDSVVGEDAFFLEANDLLEPLPAELKSTFEGSLGEGTVSDFGFTFGNLGHIIVCNKDLMDTCPQNAAEFFDAEKFPQSRTISGNHPLIAFTLAMQSYGVPTAETATTPVDIEKAVAEFEKIRPNIKVWWEAGDQMEQIMRSEEAEMGILYSGRTANLEEAGMNLELVWDGGVYNPGYWVVTEQSEHKDAAFKLMEWIGTHPEAQAKWAEYMNYSVPSAEALEQLPKKSADLQADTPANFDRLAKENFGWYVENQQEATAAFRELVSGG